MKFKILSLTFVHLVKLNLCGWPKYVPKIQRVAKFFWGWKVNIESAAFVQFDLHCVCQKSQIYLTTLQNNTTENSQRCQVFREWNSKFRLYNLCIMWPFRSVGNRVPIKWREKCYWEFQFSQLAIMKMKNSKGCHIFREGKNSKFCIQHMYTLMPSMRVRDCRLIWRH